MPFFINSVLFSQKEIWVNHLEANTALNIAHNNALPLLLFANYGFPFGILHQLSDGLRQNLSLLHNGNRLDSERSKGFLDFRRCAFVVGVNQVEGEQVVSADAVLVPLDAVAANLAL